MPEHTRLAAETAVVIRRLLESVERGELDASGRAGERLVARLRFSADALDELSASSELEPDSLLDRVAARYGEQAV
jgi:hypothetical protein